MLKELSVSLRIVLITSKENSMKTDLNIKKNVLIQKMEKSRIVSGSGIVGFRCLNTVVRTSPSSALTPFSGRFSTHVTRWQPAP